LPRLAFSEDATGEVDVTFDGLGRFRVGGYILDVGEGGDAELFGGLPASCMLNEDGFEGSVGPEGMRREEEGHVGDGGLEVGDDGVCRPGGYLVSAYALCNVDEGSGGVYGQGGEGLT
jgi:hypothetical protein